jgi:hypothetical protein
VSYRLHPHARRVTSLPWMLERRLLLRLRRCSATAGRAATCTRRAMIAPACAHAPRRACRGRPSKSWATRAVHMGQAGAMGVGHAPLCNWAERGFSPVTVELVFYFLNIFKFLQI